MRGFEGFTALTSARSDIGPRVFRWVQQLLSHGFAIVVAFGVAIIPILLECYHGLGVCFPSCAAPVGLLTNSLSLVVESSGFGTTELSALLCFDVRARLYL